MTKIINTKMVEQTEIKFIANDGKEFIGENAEYECNTYERRLNEDKVKDAFKRLNCINLRTPLIEFFYGDYGDLFQVELTSKQDYYTLIDYLVVCEGCYSNDVHIQEPKEYPCTTLVGLGCEWACEYGGNLKEELQKLLEKLN